MTLLYLSVLIKLLCLLTGFDPKTYICQDYKSCSFDFDFSWFSLLVDAFVLPCLLSSYLFSFRPNMRSQLSSNCSLYFIGRMRLPLPPCQLLLIFILLAKYSIPTILVGLATTRNTTAGTAGTESFTDVAGLSQHRILGNKTFILTPLFAALFCGCFLTLMMGREFRVGHFAPGLVTGAVL